MHRRELQFVQPIAGTLSPPRTSLKYKRVRAPGWKARLWRVAGELLDKPKWTAKGVTTLRKEVAAPLPSPTVRQNTVAIEIQTLSIMQPAYLSPMARAAVMHIRYAYWPPQDELYIKVFA